MTQYAIIKTGSKQYRVQAGDIIDVELFNSAKEGKIEFSDVLLYCNGSETKVGAPSIADAVVHAQILDQVRGPKVIAYKYKKRKNYRRKVGHRQRYMRVKITEFAL